MQHCQNHASIRCMDFPCVERIDAAGQPALGAPDREAALRQGEALHRQFRPRIEGDYISYLKRMAVDGAGLLQLIDQDEVRAIAVWRTFLTTYCGLRFEIDDLVTAEGYRSKGYGATLVHALEAKAKSLACDEVMLTSATWRTGAHRFYLRERYAISAFLFTKKLG